MPQAKGSDTRIVLDQETTYNTVPGGTGAQLVYYTSEDLRFSKTVTRDLSGGGLCVRLIEPIEQDKLLEF